jgi:chromosome segregation ATPase
MKKPVHIVICALVLSVSGLCAGQSSAGIESAELSRELRSLRVDLLRLRVEIQQCKINALSGMLARAQAERQELSRQISVNEREAGELDAAIRAAGDGARTELEGLRNKLSRPSSLRERLDAAVREESELSRQLDTERTREGDARRDLEKLGAAQ